MSEDNEVNLVKTFINKIVGVIAGACAIGLFMTFMFMTSIETTMKNTNENVNLKFMAVDKQFDNVHKRIDKIEDKTDEIRREVVPLSKQLLEDRKQNPNF